jgi:hypothetical protein
LSSKGIRAALPRICFFGAREDAPVVQASSVSC